MRIIDGKKTVLKSCIQQYCNNITREDGRRVDGRVLGPTAVKRLKNEKPPRAATAGRARRRCKQETSGGAAAARSGGEKSEKKKRFTGGSFAAIGRAHNYTLYPYLGYGIICGSYNNIYRYLPTL